MIVGLRRAWHYRPLLLIAFLANLLTAVPLALLPAYGLLQASSYPALRHAADGLDPWLAMEMILSPAAGDTPAAGNTPAAGDIVGVTLLLSAVIPTVAWLTAAFLKGGILLTYAEAPTPFTRRRFLYGCRPWFPTFLAQGFIQFLACFLLLLPLLILAITLITAAGRWLTWLLIPILLTLLIFWIIWMEYTAYLAITQKRRNLFTLLAPSLGWLLRHPLATPRLYLPALLLLALLHATYRWGLRPILPLHWWPLVLLIQQTFIFARLLLRLARWSAGLELTRPTP